MTERGLPSADASPACPFVAFEDERDERADRPDHRHRCYAEPDPAPRALAHQEAYCLSSAFPVCPTFQEWARREAAHARAGGTPTPTPAGATVTSPDPDSAEAPSGDTPDTDDDPWERNHDERPIEERPRRNPPRDWAAPPPWASGAAGMASAAGAAGGAGGAGVAGAGGAAAAGAAGPPGFVGSRAAEDGRGLAGSAADRLARDVGAVDPDLDDEPLDRPPSDHPSAPADPELAGLVGGAAVAGSRAASAGPAPVARSGRPPSVSSTRDRDREREREQRERERERGRADGPAWEGQRRLEAYPQIRPGRSLPSMSGLPRVAVLAGALAVAALALFFLPALFGVGGDGDADPTPTPTAAVATATPEPTPPPAPTPQVYVIKEGDTLSKVARAFGLTLDELLAANTETITNPDRIKVGDEIVIPVPTTDEVDGGAASESPAT